MVRMVSWNVNGVRAAARAGLVEWVRQERPDVLCLQETKADAEQVAQALDGAAGYELFVHAAARPGYSGVATLSRATPRRVRVGLGDADIDGEGRVLVLEYEDFALVNAYFPNSQDEGVRLWLKLRFCSKLLTLLRRLRARRLPALVCGDFNIAHREIDLAHPKANRRNAGFLPEERSWLDRMEEAGFVDAFRTLHPDALSYTWWSYRGSVRARNVGWRLDYFWLDARLAPRLREAFHRTEVPGSDHCPVGIELAGA